MFNNRILLNGVLIPKLLNKPFTSCSSTNLDFLIPQTGHFNCIINLLFFVLTILSIFFTLDVITFHLIFITSICKTLNYFILLCFCFKNLDLLDRQTTQFDFSGYFICHFYFLWPKVMCKVFTPKTICYSGYFSNFYRFYF